MDKKSPTRSTPMWPVFLGLGLSIIVLVVFIIEFVGLSQQETEIEAVPDVLTVETYMQTVSDLLVNADPEHGRELVQTQGCSACHLGPAAANGLAPSFVGLADRADERRQPLRAEAYIYESIVNPMAFNVEGYSAQMPQHYAQLSDQELGDIIAYLLTMTES